MHDALTPAALVALAVVTVILTRARGLLVKMAVEAALLLVIGAFLFWRGSSPLPHLAGGALGLADAWFRALAVIWWLIAARLVVNATTLTRRRDARSRGARLFSDLTAAVIYITAVLIILNSVLNLNIASLVATSGVIAIILGLALQNTLADVFSGIAVGIEQPFHVGDRVSLADNIEGVVVQLNWRSVRIHTDGDDLATVPNSLVAKGRIINRSVPTRRRTVTVDIVTLTEAPSGKIIELVGQAILLCPTILPTPAPSITLRRSGLISSVYNVEFSVADSSMLTEAKSALLRQSHRMFRHAGVTQLSPMTPVELLGSLVLFEALSSKEAQSLAAALVDRSFEPGDVVFEQGAPATSIFVVAAGVLELTRHASPSNPEALGRIGAGEYIGELGLITGSPRAFTLTALTSTRVLELPGASLKSLLQSNAALNTAMERSVRRGLAVLDRDDAAKAVQATEQATDLFARIRAFFHV